MKVNRLLIIAFAISCSGMFANAAYAKDKLKDTCRAKNYKLSVIPKKMTVREKKLRFRCLVQPTINQVYSELTARYKAVSKAVKQHKDNQEMKLLRIKYKVKNNHELLKAIKPHLKSIAMAQAAMESAWGTSRFFTNANNIFGLWSFNKKEPRLAAGKKRGNKTIWIKKYRSIKESIEDYYLVLARGRSFGEFRNLKMKSSDPYKLVAKLDRYSEKGAVYSKKLASMIRFNKLHQLD